MKYQKWPDQPVGVPGVALSGRTLEDWDIRPYHPLQEFPALYRELANVELTQEAVLGFANRYGMLGGQVRATVMAVDGPSDPVFWVEPLPAWKWRICWLREAVRLWDLISDQNRPALEQTFEKEKGGVAEYQVPSEAIALAEESGGLLWTPFSHMTLPAEKIEPFRLDPTPEPDWLVEVDAAFQQSGPVNRAQIFLAHWLVNAELDREVAPMLYWDGKRTQPVRLEMPRSLLGVVYTQLAQAIAGHRKSRQCSVCGKWFDLGLGAARGHRRVCSDTCRVRAYRIRQEQARNMHAGGRSVKQIARELNTTVDKISKWIQQGKEN
jgi:hypothetical protein